ncbi:DUF1382 family protein [Vibrio parahaemolyticus]|uniref:DUF1382 family protein n=1 Tax=Vibrio parahaemolyticus TaxID=670 RepID=UPI0008D90E3B|nr:DUF1382 family protein [Vibrio parahaemolyticus]OHX45673.1 hypothetical protein BB048_01380 [Vibrio parahaemolyticus]
MKCTAEAMRKNLELVENLRNAGIDFVPMPVVNEKDKVELAKEAIERTLMIFLMEALQDEQA